MNVQSHTQKMEYNCRFPCFGPGWISLTHWSRCLSYAVLFRNSKWEPSMIGDPSCRTRHRVLNRCSSLLSFAHGSLPGLSVDCGEEHVHQVSVDGDAIMWDAAVRAESQPLFQEGSPPTAE